MYEHSTSPMADERCHNCNAIAIVEYEVATGGSNCFYCRRHEPPRNVGVPVVGLRLLRYRLPPDNHLSKHFNCAIDSREHQALQLELCQMKLLGDDGACRYYLSRLNGVDYFAVWSDEFAGAIRDFAVARFGSAVSRYCDDVGAPMIFLGSLRQAFETRFAASAARRKSKEEVAVELLLTNPDWPDERIAQVAGTTVKQLHRFTTYGYVRVVDRRAASQQ